MSKFLFADCGQQPARPPLFDAVYTFKGKANGYATPLPTCGPAPDGYSGKRHSRLFEPSVDLLGQQNM